MTLRPGLKGARTLVTAASQGIGFATARAFVAEGARVVINSSNPQRLRRAAESLRPLGEVHPVVADLRERTALDQLVERSVSLLGGIDTLVYVTGSPRPGTFLEQDYDSWRSAAELLVVSPAYLARKVVDVMRTQGTPGRLVFLASVAIREPIATIATSSVCRISIAGLVRTLAREVGPFGIRVNGILPGYIATRRLEELFEDAERRTARSAREARSALEREIPLGRVGTPEELARATVFLGSEMSSYITGALLPVDGGFLRSVG